jgi:hypothetical protein
MIYAAIEKNIQLLRLWLYPMWNFSENLLGIVLLLNDFYAALDNNQILVFIQLHFV